MKQQLKTFLEITEITHAPVGVYDLPDLEGFAPFAKPGDCIFSDFDAWQEGKATRIDAETAGTFGCPGAGHWMAGISTMPPRAVAGYLAVEEGLKCSVETMARWLETHPPYQPEHQSVVISPIKEEYAAHLKTLTFFVRPDQLALLLTGAWYLEGNPGSHILTAPYGSGCGLMLAMFSRFDQPLAIIGGTDIAARLYFPPDTLSVTVTRPMLDQLLALDEQSFLHKSFWQRLRDSRKQNGESPITGY